MKDDMIERLRRYKVEDNDEVCSRIMLLGKKEIRKQQMSYHSYIALFKSTIHFIQPRTWIFQCITLVFCILSVSQISNTQPMKELMQSFLYILIISSFFFLDELCKSYTSGMWDLEQSLKYDVRQHTLIKLLIFGCIDLLLILIMAICAHQFVLYPMFDMLLYLLVPYNMICILMLYLVSIWRNTSHHFVAWGSMGIIFFIILWITNNFEIYQMSIYYWMFGYIGTAGLLIYVINLQIQRIRKENRLYEINT